MPHIVHLKEGSLVLSEHARERASERDVSLETIVRLAEKVRAILQFQRHCSARQFKVSWRGVTGVFAPRNGDLVLVSCWSA